MPVLQFKGKTAVECYHYSVPHHTLDLVQTSFDTYNDEKAKLNICESITATRIRRVIKGYQYNGVGGKKEKVRGVLGAFSYARLGPPLFGEYRDFGKKLPSFEDLSKYIFYTETNSDFDAKKVNLNTGKIGESAGTSYFLLYTPNGTEDRALAPVWLQATVKADKYKPLVVYCEKIWIHRDDLTRFEQETGCKVRPMLVPFNLK